jgi:hypothetical protein
MRADIVAGPCLADERHDPEDEHLKGAGAPDRIRTCDLRLRRPTLYPLSYRRAGSRDDTAGVA